MRSLWHHRDEAPADDVAPITPAGILVVCTANVCRSPVAEAMLRRRLADGGVDIPVRSAGTNARAGHAATEGMQRATAPWRLDLAPHQSQPVTRDLALAHALVVTMEARHRGVVAQLDPSLGARTFTLPELAALSSTLLAEGAPPADDLASLVTVLHRTRPRVVVDMTDVDDPIGGSDERYEATTRELDELIDPVAHLLVRTLGPG